MKKNLFLMTMFIWGMFSSCSDDIQSDPETGVHVKNQNREYAFAYKTVTDSDTESPQTRSAASKYYVWKPEQTITIKFLNGNTQEQEKVKEVAQEWLNYANVNFNFVDSATKADIRIGFNYNGSKVNWSYIGTEVKRITSQKTPTMNLVLYDESWDEINSAYFRGNILREFGHVLGLYMEHQSPAAQLDWIEDRVYAYYRPFGMTDTDIQKYILKTYPSSQVSNTEFDENSVMLIFIPPHLTTDGRGTNKLNTELSQTDKEYISAIYPGKTFSKPATIPLQFSFDSKKKSVEYTGVLIGEYYWVNNNFYHEVPRDYNSLVGWENDYPITQARLDKYLPCARLDVSQYQINTDDFVRYYGIYYNRQSVDYMSANGKIYENNSQTPSNWELPSVADFRQLFAMCPVTESGALREQDVRFALSAKYGDNPLAFNINDPAGGPYRTYWFMTGDNIDIYDFNLMPGGAKLNGTTGWNNGLDDPHPGVIGDIYHLFYTAGFYTKESNVYIHDYIDTYNPYSYHWYNVRWCKRLTDAELGYKLYINENKTDIKKLGLLDTAPSGYTELPKGYIRGFYVQYILNNPNPKYTVEDIVRFANNVQDQTKNQI